MDNTFVYNIVAKCIVLFDESPQDFLNLFYSPFNFHSYSHFYSQLLN